MIAEVIVDIAVSETDRVFDYACADDMQIGSRVRAPFGGRTLCGFVIGLKEKTDYDGKLRSVTLYEDGLPALTKECLSLAKKIAARYRVPLAAALRLFLPSEMRTGRSGNLRKITQPCACRLKR